MARVGNFVGQFVFDVAVGGVLENNLLHHGLIGHAVPPLALLRLQTHAAESPHSKEPYPKLKHEARFKLLFNHGGSHYV